LPSKVVLPSAKITLGTTTVRSKWADKAAYILAPYIPGDVQPVIT